MITDAKAKGLYSFSHLLLQNDIVIRKSNPQSQELEFVGETKKIRRKKRMDKAEQKE